MSSIKKINIFLLCLTVILLQALTAYGAEEKPPEPLLPEGLVIEESFRPGIGLPVGKVLLAQGKVVTIHENETTGFYTQRNQSIFKGDKIVTLEKGRIRIKLNDGSIITLASETKIVINKSVYNPEKKTRSSFVGMDKGKARFLIKKMVDYKNNEFNVKTKTAVAGVRGSEFIIRATEFLTEIITLEDTRLVVTSLAYQCVDDECKPKSIFLNDFEKTVVAIDELPTEVEIVSPEEVEKIERSFFISPDIIAPDVDMEALPKKTKTEDAKEDTGEAPTDKPTGEAPVDEPTGEAPGVWQEAIAIAEEEAIIPVGPVYVLVPEEELVQPVLPPQPFESQIPVPVLEFFTPSQVETVGEEVLADKQEAVIEEVIEGELPGFPGLPY